MAYVRLTPDKDWAAGLVAGLPNTWRQRMLSTWEQEWSRARAQANTQLRHRVQHLAMVRVPLDASDDTICAAADLCAQRCADLATLYHDAATLRQAMNKACASQGIEPPDAEHGPAIQRMTDPLWWRRKLRQHHGRTVEATAIGLGYVHKGREIYCSNETLNRHQQQARRNAAMLENTLAINELGQEYELAELAAKGTANKAVRRAELMTRIAGFERIAKDFGHEGLFMTTTCPSRMHRCMTVNDGKKVLNNPKYDGTTPRQANRYLGKVWGKIRTALGNAGCKVYGFRIAEPQHDGTPHWHFLVFHEVGQLERIKAIVSKRALADSPDERGAAEHRCDFKVIDWERGSAAGYIAKYVAKNIDGYALETDLHGTEAMVASQRVAAWASTWGIRQFQQVGGPPVTVWRELRRIEAVPDDAPDYLREAWQAVNKLNQIEGRDHHSYAWDRYVRAQGGVFCGRKYRVRLATVERDGLNRYGEPLAPAPWGVETLAVETYTPAHMAWMGGLAERTVHWAIESKRYTWRIVKRTGLSDGTGKGRACAASLYGGVSMGTCAQSAPWTRVNNCTEGVANGHRINQGEAQGSENGLLKHEPDGAWGGGAGSPAADGGAGDDGRGAWFDGERLQLWESLDKHGRERLANVPMWVTGDNLRRWMQPH